MRAPGFIRGCKVVSNITSALLGAPATCAEKLLPLSRAASSALEAGRKSASTQYLDSSSVPASLSFESTGHLNEQLNIVDVTHMSKSGVGAGSITILKRNRNGNETLRTTTVEVVGSAVGDKVKARLAGKLRGQRQALIEELLVKSPHRVEPKCKYYGECGGCSLQHIEQQKQLNYKFALVREEFRRALHPHDVTDSIFLPPSIAPSEHLFRYRNKVEFTYGEKPWTPRSEIDRALEKKQAAGAPSTINENFVNQFLSTKDKEGPVLGFMPRMHPLALQYWRHSENKGKTVEINDCLLIHESAGVLAAAIQEKARELKISPYRPFRHDGFLLGVTLRIGYVPDEGTQVMVIFRTAYKDLALLQPFVDHLVSLSLPTTRVSGATDESVQLLEPTKLISISAEVDAQAWRHHLKNAPDDRDRDTAPEIMYGDRHIYTSMNGKLFRISPESFVQPNARVASCIYSRISQECVDTHLSGATNEGLVVWDLFCGIGSIGVCIADKVKTVVGIDVVESALDDAMENAKLNGANNMTFHHLDLERIRSNHDAHRTLEKLPSPDIVIVNPPRPGLHTFLTFYLNAILPKKIIYLSCNPKSLAQDIARFTTDINGNFAIKYVQTYDQFPHTTHVESLCVMEKKSA